MTTEPTPAFAEPTPLRVGAAGLHQEAGNVLPAVQAIIDEARAWGILGIDLEWTQDGRITWVGLGTAKRASSFWWPTMPVEARKLIEAAFASAELPKLGQNGIQADRAVWEREVGPTGGTWEDTMLLHHATFPGIAHDLQAIVAQFQVVPPWKVWRRTAMAEAENQRRMQAKADKKAERVAAHEARNAARAAEKQARLEAKKAGKEAKIEAKAAAKSAKQLAHEAKIAAQIAERERKKAEKQAAHQARNDAAAAAGKKGRRKAATAPAPGSPPAGVVTPMAPEPPAPPPVVHDGDEFPFETLPENGLVCSVCGEPQRMSPRGETCANGHGGVPGVEPPPFTMETPEEMGGQDAQPPVPAVVPPPPPPPPVAVQAPVRLLKPPQVVGPGGSLLPGRVAFSPPAPNGKRIKVVVTGADGTEIEIDPSEVDE